MRLVKLNFFLVFTYNDFVKANFGEHQHHEHSLDDIFLSSGYVSCRHYWGIMNDLGDHFQFSV